jgi:hypothetical protein
VQLEANLVELRAILDRMTGVAHANGAEREAATTFVVAGPNAYHRPACKLVAGRDLRKLTPEQAAGAGLAPCRTCRPPEVPASVSAEIDLASS